MIVEDIAIAALARALEFTNGVPSTRSVMYRRIGIRQQQLFARAAGVNPDYFGICATGALDNGAADLSDMAPPVEKPESITKIEVSDPGTSTYLEDQEIRVVPSTDVTVDLPPRATLRNRVIRQVENDLDGVASIRIHYARVPEPIGPSDSDKVVELADPHSELLVIDLTKSLLLKTISMDAATKAAAFEGLNKEEGELLEAFDQHVASFTGSLSSRFGERQ